MVILQNILLPSKNFSQLSDEFYLKTVGNKEKYNTYFNLLNIETLKERCSLDNLQLKVSGRGHFNVSLIASNDLIGEEVVANFTFGAEVSKEQAFEVSSWKSFKYKFLFVEVEKIVPSEIVSISFASSSPVVTPVKLGVVIVHYNRKDWVLPALKRLKLELLNDEEYKSKIALVVVDNSQNITDEESCGVNIIKNKNLGGSGGFTRGMLHFKDLNYTHCLFMDDDASCEIESIKRTWALLSYAIVPRFSIAGSLLTEESPTLIYEKGATFKYVNKAQFSGYDMSVAEDLAAVEKCISEDQYGGWWFFAFKISDAVFFPFPFFVRGDDIMFSLLNRLNVYTTNGIGCWGDDFALKATPLSCYLDVRSLILNNLCSSRQGIIGCLIFLSKHFFLHLLSLNYASVRAIRDSLYDTSLGPTFWKENMDTEYIRGKIASYSQKEKMLPLNLKDFNYDICPVPSHRYLKGVKPPIDFSVYIRALLFNGAFLPDFLMKKNYLLIPKGKYGGLKYAFRYNKIIYFDEKTATGYVAKLNRKLLLRESMTYFGLCLKILLNRKKYRADLEKAVEMYTKESFWRSVYS